MAERITGGQTSCYVTGANSQGSSILPAGLIVAIDSWDIEPTWTFEDHNEVGNPRTVRQLTAQQIKVTLSGGDVDGTELTMAALQSANFLNKNPTAKFNVRITGSGSDGAFDRTVKWCTYDSVKVSSPAGNKTVTKALTFTGEEID